MPRSPDARFAEKYTVTESGCWEWTGYRTRDGYGSFWTGERYPGPSRSPIMALAHRWIYERLVGPIPEGHNVCHRCDNPPCVNPAHLFTGTQRANVHDCIRKGRHRNGRRLLSAEEVDLVRLSYRGEYGDVKRLAAEFDVSKKIIQNAVRDLPRTGRLVRS